MFIRAKLDEYEVHNFLFTFLVRHSAMAWQRKSKVVLATPYMCFVNINSKESLQYMMLPKHQFFDYKN